MSSKKFVSSIVVVESSRSPLRCCFSLAYARPPIDPSARPPCRRRRRRPCHLLLLLRKFFWPVVHEARLRVRARTHSQRTGPYDMCPFYKKGGEQPHVRGQMPVRPPRQRSRGTQATTTTTSARTVITTMNTKAAEFIPWPVQGRT